MALYTDEDTAFAAAQWASGIKQKDLGILFGYPNGSTVCVRIKSFIRKYTNAQTTQAYGYTLLEAQGHRRRALIKDAIHNFVTARNAHLDTNTNSIEVRNAV